MPAVDRRCDAKLWDGDAKIAPTGQPRLPQPRRATPTPFRYRGRGPAGRAKIDPCTEAVPGHLRGAGVGRTPWKGPDMPCARAAATLLVEVRS